MPQLSPQGGLRPGAQRAYPLCIPRFQAWGGADRLPTGSLVNNFGGVEFYVQFCKCHSAECYTLYRHINITIMILSNKSLATPDVIRNLGLRFRDYRLRLRMTRKEVSEAASIGLTTLYKFESGNMTDISFSTLLRLLRVIGLGENWETLLPELPDSPYMYDDNDRKVQRVRKSKRSEL